MGMGGFLMNEFTQNENIVELSPYVRNEINDSVVCVVVSCYHSHVIEIT